MRLPAPPLLVITDRKQAHAPLDDVLDAAFAAGCRWASIREQDLPAAEQAALARLLQPVAWRHGALLTIHGDPRIAQTVGLDGVHLAAGGDARAARALLGEHALIGISVHTIEETAALDPSLVDYAVAGPIYPTLSKPGYGPFLGPEGIGTMCEATTIPIVAIGGIGPSQVAELRLAGAAGIAVMGGVMRTVDVAAEVRALLAP